MYGKLVFIPIGIGLLALVGVIADNQISVNVSAMLCLAAVVLLLVIGNVLFGKYYDPLPREIREENHAVVIESIPGVGLCVTSESGKELIVQEYGKKKVMIWNTDKRGMVTGKPLIAKREGEAAYIINGMMR
jgi:hypothetical protein